MGTAEWKGNRRTEELRYPRLAFFMADCRPPVMRAYEESMSASLHGLGWDGKIKPDRGEKIIEFYSSWCNPEIFLDLLK